jgi:hypothetical protein
VSVDNPNSRPREPSTWGDDNKTMPRTCVDKTVIPTGTRLKWFDKPWQKKSITMILMYVCIYIYIIYVWL